MDRPTPNQMQISNSASPAIRVLKPEEEQLLAESRTFSEQYGAQFPAICSFVQKETERVTKGLKTPEEERFIDLESGKPIKLTYKVLVPIEKYPNFNYVGRILGPKGATLRGMQEVSGCKMAVLGKGSMRDKAKEDECRKEGGKYEHLNEPLQVWIQAFGPPDAVFYKLFLACKEVKTYLHADYNDDIFTEQMAMLEAEGGNPGAVRGRGGPRGAPRGGMRGRGGVPSSGGLPPPNRSARMPAPSPDRGGSRGGGLRGRGMGRAAPNAVRPPPPGRGGGMVRPPAYKSEYDNIYEDVYEPAPASGYEKYAGAGVGGYDNGSDSMSRAPPSYGYGDYEPSGDSYDAYGQARAGVKREHDNMYDEPAATRPRYAVGY